MNCTRRDESAESAVFRVRRVYVTNDGWYFDSREGIQFGPFHCQASAVSALAVYVAQHVDECPDCRANGYEPAGQQDGIAHMVDEVLDVLRRHREFGPLAASTWARSRIEQLKTNTARTPVTIGAIRVLEFVLNHPEETFRFETFLQNRAG